MYGNPADSKEPVEAKFQPGSRNIITSSPLLAGAISKEMISHPKVQIANINQQWEVFIYPKSPLSAPIP
jgi:hypothetical protein